MVMHITMTNMHQADVFFSIKRDGLTLDLSVAYLDDLLLHEETVEPAVEELSRRIVRDGVVKHPIIADTTTLVVLDGMHRVEAARRAGLDKIVVCRVDYTNPEVKVFRWFRVMRGPEEFIGKALPSSEFSRVRREEGMLMLDRREVASAVFTRDAAYVSRHSASTSVASSKVARDIERGLASIGFDVSYESESDALSLLDSGAASLVVAHQPVNKWDVLKAALSGELFAHKSTRHVVPARPLFVNVPLDLLSPSTSMEDAVSALAERFEGASYSVLPPGSKVGSRKYQEVVYVFGELR